MSDAYSCQSLDSHLSKQRRKSDTEYAAHRNKNCRFRLDTSIVSMSITSICPNPVRAKSFSSSQPRPPAPTTSTLQTSSLELYRIRIIQHNNSNILVSLKGLYFSREDPHRQWLRRKSRSSGPGSKPGPAKGPCLFNRH